MSVLVYFKLLSNLASKCSLHKLLTVLRLVSGCQEDTAMGGNISLFF